MSASSSCTSWKLATRPAELPALARVCDRRVEAALRDPDAPGAERDAAVVERRHRDLEALAELAEPRRVGDADAVEEELGGVLRAQAELALDRPRLEAGGVGRDDEARDAARPGLARAREDERVRRPRAERDEDLLAAEHPVVAVAHGARLERRPGPSRRRARSARSSRAPAGGERRQELARAARRCPIARPTSRRARSRRRRCRARSSRRARAPRRRACTRPCRAPCRRAPRAAPRRGSPSSASLPTTSRSIASARSHSAACGAISASQNVPRGLPDQLLLVAEGEVHGGDPRTKKPPGRWRFRPPHRPTVPGLRPFSVAREASTYSRSVPCGIRNVRRGSTGRKWACATKCRSFRDSYCFCRAARS